MPEALEKLHHLLGEHFDLTAAANVLEWDQQVNMPPGGAEDRAYQLGTLRELAHKRLTSDELGETLERAREEAAGLDPDSDDARLVQRVGILYAKQRKVPAEWVAEKEHTTALAFEAWQRARKAANFAAFKPSLEQIVALMRDFSGFFAPYDHIYDPLLDEYETGLKTETVRSVFNQLRPQQVELVRQITERGPVDSATLHQPFDERKQWDFAEQILREIGYDFNRGRQDKAPHPFSIHFGIGDVRITTRVDPSFFPTLFFASLHEMGHALYEQGVDPALSRTPLDQGTSYAVHESQSRLWENLVGLSRPFWRFLYPRLQSAFPERFGNVDEEAFYRAINKVEPSLIRVEADEATYNLHIMLRFELELALLEGNLEVADLPEAWNEKTMDYLGLTPPDDAKGVLQDIHWSSGYLGYFPTYALGNLIACQLWEKLAADIPEVEAQIEGGDFAPLLGWLRENIHRHGAKFLPGELVERATGRGLDAAPYIAYLRGKFGQIYALS